MYIDYHLHSHFSCDSKNNLDAICQTAIAIGLNEIAITDHVDFSYPLQKPNHAISDFEYYFDTLAIFQQRYHNRLTIRQGVEIGLEPHRMEDYARLLERYPFDFVIGSVHEVNGQAVSRMPYFLNKTKEQAYYIYYQAVLENISCFDQFDVLGHLDYCKRYCPHPYAPTDPFIANDLVAEILQKLIAKGKGIEVNTSGFRHVSHMSMPHIDIIKQFYDLGGRRITVGSDSHQRQYIGLQVKEMHQQLAAIGFATISTFEQRQEIPQPIG